MCGSGCSRAGSPKDPVSPGLASGHSPTSAHVRDAAERSRGKEPPGGGWRIRRGGKPFKKVRNSFLWFVHHQPGQLTRSPLRPPHGRCPVCGFGLRAPSCGANRLQSHSLVLSKRPPVSLITGTDRRLSLSGTDPDGAESEASRALFPADARHRHSARRHAPKRRARLLLKMHRLPSRKDVSRVLGSGETAGPQLAAAHVHCPPSGPGTPAGPT